MLSRAGGARLLAVVLLKPGDPGRHYRLPIEGDYEAVRKSQICVAKILNEWERRGKQGMCPVPDEPLPPTARWVFVSSGTACSSGATFSRRDRRWR